MAKEKNKKFQKGVSLYIALMIVAIMLTIIFGLSGILLSQIKSVRNVGYSVTAYYAAETGIEEALADSSCVDSTCHVTGSLDIGSTFDVTWNASGNGGCPASGVDHCLKSIGTYQGTKRAIQISIASFSSVPPSFACGDNVSFAYNGSQVTYGTVAGANGTCWMDRNLGASEVATAYNDANAYGDLFQWGRCSDGHQSRTSGNYAGPVSSSACSAGNPWDGKFVTNGSFFPYDWLSTQDNTLWQGASNDPCPSGWRVPTETEWGNEVKDWIPQNYNGAFYSPLKLTAAGGRRSDTGALFDVDSVGYYWSSNTSSAFANVLYFNNISEMLNSTAVRAEGFSVRCIKD